MILSILQLSSRRCLDVESLFLSNTFVNHLCMSCGHHTVATSLGLGVMQVRLFRSLYSSYIIDKFTYRFYPDQRRNGESVRFTQYIELSNRYNLDYHIDGYGICGDRSR